MARLLALSAAFALAALSVACASSPPPGATPHHSNCDRFPAGSANCFAAERPTEGPAPVADRGITSTRHAPVQHETQARSTTSAPRSAAPAAPRPTPPPRPR